MHQTRGMKYASVKFEVSGRVQGVFFRKYTKKKAEELGLAGWCRNTPRETVEGEYEYALEEGGTSSPSLTEGTGGRWASEAFRHWLCNVGSPHSRIEGCTFSEEAIANSRRFERFRVVH